MNALKMARSFRKMEVEIEIKSRLKTRMAGKNARDAGLSATNKIKRVMKGALDRFHRDG